MPAAAADDLAVVIVTIPREPEWLPPCLASIDEHAGELALDVVVADNDSSESTRELVERALPGARVVPCENRGFAYANNRAIMTCNARYVLFLNPDTEILSGTLEDLVRELDARPDVGLAGVRQVTADGSLFPTIRYFPNALRALGDGLATERLPRRPRWLGERELDLARYGMETACDWTSGSFMLARREALESSGLLDERFFIYAEETDLCLRIKRAGWEIVHFPSMTILHHAEKAGFNGRRAAQDAFARLQYARKNFSPAHRLAYRGALILRHALRLVGSGPRAAASHSALRVLLGADGAPYAPPPPQAVAPREQAPAPTPLRQVSAGSS